MKRLIIMCFLAFPLMAAAQDFVYTPVNPAFGGNTYNYSWLMSSADAQKKQPSSSTSSALDLFNQSQTSLSDFTNNLNSQILNQLSSRILQDQFGNFSLQNGQYNIGNYQIDIKQGTQGIDINILDTQTGGQSSVTIPNQ
ncbi:curli production assembly/transport component CsgF [Prolixibacter denitrificans]|uniref:Curli production assembly/transport component CsgF n=2 Tax=Prolixibacter denitrificans TaxID=1541063 RepID=A0A2P8CAI9_9BACT|nr:curli production assembly/transport component CsgF [Prolixibacter denitrificans]PSK81991.1 curli production assembly/transport component CsgF [Prolixibacter denitrificans]